MTPGGCCPFDDEYVTNWGGFSLKLPLNIHTIPAEFLCKQEDIGSRPVCICVVCQVAMASVSTEPLPCNKMVCQMISSP
jgi:hypothetical protein